MNERLIHLRIKVKSLVDEARTIREEAKKTSGMAKWRLNHHRTTVVREHTRFNLLAYGLLKSIPYKVMEQKCDELPNLHLVAKTAKHFGGEEELVDSWIAEAKKHLASQQKGKAKNE